MDKQCTLLRLIVYYIYCKASWGTVKETRNTMNRRTASRLFVALLTVALMVIVGVSSASAQGTQMMPDREVLSGNQVVIWGNTTEGAGPVTISFGDGTPDETPAFNINSQSYIATTHTYTTAFPQEDFTATLTVGASSASVTITVIDGGLLTASQLEEQGINDAIQDGLRYQYYSVSSREVRHDSGWLLAQWSGNRSFTSMVTLSFENHGHTTTSGDIYSPVVQGGLNEVFKGLLHKGIVNEAAGTNCVPGTLPLPLVGPILPATTECNGLTPTSAGHIGYSTSIALLAIGGSGTPLAVVGPGLGTTSGQRYVEVAQRLINTVAWGQADSGSDRGGWQYGLDNNRSDGSAIGWNVLGLLDGAAFGATIPAHVAGELELEIENTTDAFGAMGYRVKGSIPNTAKTGVRLQALSFIGVPVGGTTAVTTVTPQKSIDYVNDGWNLGGTCNWGQSGLHPSGGNRLNQARKCIYATFNVFKGLKLFGVTTLPNVPRADFDWHKDYQTFLVGVQTSPTSATGGHWSTLTASGFTTPAKSALALLVLSPTALILPDKDKFAAVGLSPATDSGPAAGSHTVTALAESVGGAPVPGATVNFLVLTGPNAGATGSAVTNAAGTAGFTYTDTLSTAANALDTIQASIGSLDSNIVDMTWIPPNLPPVPNAGADRPEATAAGLCEATVSLNGSATDPDTGDSLTFTWTGADGVIADPTAAVTTVSGLGLGAHTFKLTVSDGTVSVFDEVVITVEDQEPPTISINPLSPNGNAGWFKFPTLTGVLVQATAADNCSVDVTVETTGAQVAAEAAGSSVTINTDGVTTVEFEAIDGAGNMADASTVVKLDRAVPVITLSSTPPPNGAGWNNTDVTLSFACTDPTPSSGGPSCPADLVFTDEGEFPGAVTSTDVAGNVGSLPYLVKIDKTAPEMKNVFNEDTLTVDVLALDDGSGVTSDPIVPVCVPTSWGSGKASAKASGKGSVKGPNAELCTYTVTDAAGNTTVLVEKRKTTGSNASKKGSSKGSGKNSSKGGGGGETQIEVVSIQYNDGDVIAFPPKADKKFEWSLNSDGTLKELEQKMELGKGATKQQVTAHYSSKKGTTEINVHGGDGKLVGDGLTLLCMISSDGELDIVFDPTGLTPKNSVKSSLKAESTKASEKPSEKPSKKSSEKPSKKGSGKG